MRLGAGSNQVNTVNLVKTHTAPIKFLALRPAVCLHTRMRKEGTLPVRLETEQRSALHRISAELTITPSNITRMLVKAFVTHYDRNKGKVVFPLTFKHR